MLNIKNMESRTLQIISGLLFVLMVFYAVSELLKMLWLFFSYQPFLCLGLCGLLIVLSSFFILINHNPTNKTIIFILFGASIIIIGWIGYYPEMKAFFANPVIYY
ncbi:hypothetical protein ACFL1Y_00865 [Patescibacteria group bacterium]